MIYVIYENILIIVINPFQSMSITTIVGPMFSGKTTELIRLVDRQNISKKRCLIIKNTIDHRFDANDDRKYLITHSKMSFRKCDIILLSSFVDLTAADNIIANYDVVGIDEGFFFDGITEFCTKLANNGVDVIVSTIDTSYKQQVFDQISKLMALSETIIKLNAVCHKCLNDKACFTIMLDNKKSSDTIFVGGEETYQSVCRKCLYN